MQTARDSDNLFATIDLTLPHVVLHMKEQRCRSCNTTHRWSEVYECETEGNVRKMKPLSGSSLPVGVNIIPIRLPPTTIAICHDCIRNKPVMTDAVAAARWEETRKRKAQELRAANVVELATRTQPTRETPVDLL